MKFGYANKGLTYRVKYTKPKLIIDELNGTFHGEYDLD